MATYRKFLEQCQARNKRIRELRKMGHLLGDIAKQHGISKQRVWQILQGER